MYRRDLIKYILLTTTLIIKPNKTISIGNLPNIGEKAPLFSLDGFNNNSKLTKNYTLSDFTNQWVVIYFYPEDFTKSCTLEAKGFSSLTQEFHNLNSEIIAISSDSIDKHKDFCNENTLEIPILSDPYGITSNSYGSWNGYNSNRNTFLISPNGIIKARWIGVKPLALTEEVLSKLKLLRKV